MRGWTPRDVLPPVCKQGVGVRVPLAPQVRSEIRTAGTDCTAAKYSSRDHMRCRASARAGLRPRPAAAGDSTQVPRAGRSCGPLSRKNTVLPVPACRPHDQRPASGNCRFIVAPAAPAEGQPRRVTRYFMSTMVCFPVTHHEFMAHISPTRRAGSGVQPVPLGRAYCSCVRGAEQPDAFTAAGSAGGVHGRRRRQRGACLECRSPGNQRLREDGRGPAIPRCAGGRSPFGVGAAARAARALPGGQPVVRSVVTEE
jgi:hypothetical protein